MNASSDMPTHRTSGSRASSVVMLLENNPYPEDVRVRREAESLARSGYRVTVVAPRGAGQPWRESVRGVGVVRFPLPQGESGAGLVVEYLVANLVMHALGAVAVLRGAAVLHLHNPPDTLFPLALLARAAGRRVVFDQHDLFPELTSVKTGSRAAVAAARACERLSCRAAHVVICANESHAELVRGRAAAPAAAVAVVRNGPPRALLRAGPSGRSGSIADPHLVYVGAMSSQDGAERLPHILRALVEEHGLEGARLTLVGDGPARDAVEREARAAGVSDRVSVTGWVPLDDVPRFLADADLCVDPAPATELNERSTMIKVAEYLAAGRAVVAYRLRETARTAGDAAVLVPGGDEGAFASALADLARDERRRRSLEERARARAEQLVWERSEEVLLRAYAALTG